MKKLFKKLLFISRKKIGQGWDYLVFRSDQKGRVIKIMQPLCRQLWLRKEMPWRILGICTKKGSRREHMVQTVNSLRPLLEKHGHMFANPRFIGTSYIQDEVVTLRNFLKKADDEKALSVINKLCLLNEKCWSLGFSNTNFKFSSYGVTDREEVVLIDLSGLTFSRKRIEGLLTSKRWILSFDIQLLLSNKLNLYYKKRLEESKNKLKYLAMTS